MFTKIISLFALCVVGNVHAQIEYTTNATVAWTAFVSPVLAGNGVYMSTDGALAIVVSRDTTITALNPLNGIAAWTVRAGSQPDAATFGGAEFCYGATPFVLVSVVESNVSTAVALSLADGSVVGRFGGMLGTVAGTPVTTNDCQYILATHNVDGSKGYFSMYSFADQATPIFTFVHPTIDNEPFGAIGYYWNPIRGNFAGGEGNTNDVFIWSFDTNMNEPNGTVGTSQVFGFQLPTNPNIAPNVTFISGDRDYQAKTAPVITDDGLSMYWCVSRSKVYGWVGDGSARSDFSTNGVANFGFTRLDLPDVPKYLSASTRPSLSNSSDGFVVGTASAAEIWVWNRNFTGTPTVQPTTTVITSRLVVSPDDTFVYYADGSRLYQVNSPDLTPVWDFALTGNIEGDIAQTVNGARIIAVDVAGSVTAVTVATADEGLAPIPVPPPTVPTAIITAPPVVATGPPSTPAPVSGPVATTLPTTSPAPTSSEVPVSESLVPTMVGMTRPPGVPTTPTVTRPTVPTPTAPTTSAAATLTSMFAAWIVVASTSIVAMA